MDAIKVRLLVEFEIKPSDDALPDWHDGAIEQWYTEKQLLVVAVGAVKEAMGQLEEDGFIDSVSGDGELVEEVVMGVSCVSVRLAP